MVEEQKLKTDIIDKFGSITRFAKQANIQTLEIYSTFRMKDSFVKTENLKKLEKLHNKLTPGYVDNDWRPGLGKAIKNAVRIKYDTILNFCEKHPEYSSSWMSLIINEKFRRVTKKTQGLCKLLKINHTKVNAE